MGLGRDRECLLKKYGISFRGDENALELDSGGDWRMH